jgi:hypothetical protein
MSDMIQFAKVTALPATLVPNTVYLVGAGAADELRLYMTNSAGTATRHIVDKSEIQTMITNTVTGYGNAVVVADIAARNALAPAMVQIAVVQDATGDATVATGAATYVYDPVTTTWSKIAEHSAIDLVPTWAALQDKPTSTVAAIDDAVAKVHVHANKVQLDQISEDAGLNFMFRGEYPRARLETVGW